MSLQQQGTYISEAGHACSSCSECDGRLFSEVATYPVARARQADATAASLGGDAHTHYIVRGDRLTVVVPKGPKES